ncbi:MAG: stage III sporulation protein AA [Firmicutes bacterium]|nr:stage III sporulation protein AA [Bacillota bacterium]
MSIGLFTSSSQTIRSVKAKIFLSRFQEQVLSMLAPEIRQLVGQLPERVVDELEEIRLRQSRPLILRVGQHDLGLLPDGRLSPDLERSYRVSAEDMHKTLQLLSNSSVYALEEEFRNGYITVRGGHRIGLVGRVVMDKGRIKTLKHIAGLNFRIARQVIGAADPVMPFLLSPGEARPYHTLIISPPQCGKTTLLRDIIRQMSNGVPRLNFPGVNVAVVDERSEIAGCYEGVPQHDVGIRTDVLDNCPKAEGMVMVIRSMSPQIIATDEIGRAQDVSAIEDILSAGITLVTTVHGRSLAELEQRPALRSLLGQRIFERYVILSRRRGAGTVEAVIDAKSLKTLSG